MCVHQFYMMTMRSANNNYNGNNELPLPRTKYLKHTLHLTLEEMFSGTIRKLAVNKNVVCDVCHGSGSASEIAEDFDTCEECNGLGVRLVIRRSAHDGHDIEEQIERDCELCWGKGEAVIQNDRCLNCQGRKTVPEQSILKVKVRRGTRHGQKIIYKDEGTQEPNMRPGDVVVILEAVDHQTFKRQGDDLFVTIHLDLVESLCGFEKIVTTLDKRQLRIRSHCGDVVRENDIKFIPGEGMPKYVNPTERGNLIIQFAVNLPPRICARHVAPLEACLPPREIVDIPMDAVECNLVDLPPVDEDYHDQNHSAYDVNADDYNQDQNYDPQFQTHEQYEHENGMHQYGSDDQYDEQGPYYQDDEYAIHENYEHPSEYDQQYYHSQPGYDTQQDQFYQQGDECESLESYDATQQYRFND